MAELLLEILSEEIPARMQTRAADDLKRLICDGLKKAGLDFDSANSYVTPRRLTLVVDGLPTETPDISEERRGPKTDAPEKAVQGFLGSVGLTLGDLEKRETDKGEFYFAKIEKKGQKTADLLVGLIEGAMQGLPWPKSMRWAGHTVRWVRPMQGIVCVFDGGVVPVSFGPIEAGNKTQAHRFLTDAIVEVKDFDDYKKALETGHVLIDPLERRAAIKGDADALAAKAGLKMIDDPALLDEVAGLVEWPVALMGSIDDEFMDVPPEVLTTTMRKNQKYFALEDKKGNLAPNFIVVANKETPDGGAAIVAGNERVLRARLADAKFFWDQDQKKKLEEYLPQLTDITFHAKLGTVAEKMERVGQAAVELSGEVGADKKLISRAAKLAKADLVTGMVIEFPDLQGIMGRYYALEDKETPEVATAIAEHYSPLGPSDECPTAPVSVAVALADKIDTLVGFWAIDEKPTGSKDPYALRRAALGVIRLIVENELRCNLDELFIRAWNLGDYGGEWHLINDDFRVFLRERIKIHLKGKGVRPDLISAVFARPEQNDICDILARVNALTTFIETEGGLDLLTAYKRADNILRIEEKKDKVTYDQEVDAAVLDQAEELEMHKGLTLVTDAMSQNLADEDYAGAMSWLASLRMPVDDFFDEVTVNCEDATLRVNRLRLLSQIRTTMNQVADFSQIEGGER
tara:strand:+ start:484 stop:2553 length:2070 start_codon:yes stop_codon:yes gene_type:complete